MCVWVSVSVWCSVQLAACTVCLFVGGEWRVRAGERDGDGLGLGAWGWGGSGVGDGAVARGQLGRTSVQQGPLLVECK